MHLEKPCEVITFYSYTGGAGRSMALANVACLLAPRCRPGRGVLMVDWSLQSASLHRYFQNKLESWHGQSDRTGNKLDLQPGLFDLFVEIEGANRFHDIAKPFRADRRQLIPAKDVEDATSHGELAALLDARHALITRFQKQLPHPLQRNRVADAQSKQRVTQYGRVRDLLGPVRAQYYRDGRSGGC